MANINTIGLADALAKQYVKRFSGGISREEARAMCSSSGPLDYCDSTGYSERPVRSSKCSYCGNSSGLKNTFGNCLSCGAPRD